LQQQRLDPVACHQGNTHAEQNGHREPDGLLENHANDVAGLRAQTRMAAARNGEAATLHRYRLQRAVLVAPRFVFVTGHMALERAAGALVNGP